MMDEGAFFEIEADLRDQISRLEALLEEEAEKTRALNIALTFWQQELNKAENRAHRHEGEADKMMRWLQHIAERAETDGSYTEIYEAAMAGVAGREPPV